MSQAALPVVLCLLVCSSSFAQQRPARQQPVSEMAKAVEEFKTQTRDLGLRLDSPASARRNGHSGSKWHGRLFEYFRNDFLDAVPHEIVQRGGTRSLLRRNQFGLNVAGPVVIPKLYHSSRSTFFSFSYEGMRERISRASLHTVPTLPERTGDWTSVVDPAGSPLPVFDPRSTRRNPAYNPALPVSVDNLEYLRDPFPANRIPAGRLDPIARKAVEFYPAPNTNVGPFDRNNYFVVSPETNHANGIIAKVDHTFAERHRLAFGTSISNGFAGAARLFNTPADPGPSDREFSARRGSLEHVFTVSARTVNTFTFEISSNTSVNEPNLTPDSSLGLPGVSSAAFPNFRFSPYLSMGRSSPLSRNARNSFVWTDAFSTRRGSHGLRAVTQFAHSQINVFVPQYPSGSFRFSPAITSLPGIVNTGHGFASFLLGLSEFAEVNLVDSPSYFRRSTGLIALRDNYEAAKGFTIHLGLNIDMSTPRIERYNRQSTVDLSAARPDGRRGALIAAGREGRGRSFQPFKVNLEPSASISWNPLGDAKTVVRAAYSRSYQPIPVYAVQWGTQGFNGSPAFISANVQLEPALTISNGLPPLAHPLPDLRPEAADNTIADLTDTSGNLPVYQSASLSVEYELPGSIVMTVGAGHSGGRNLLVSNGAADPNAIPLAALSFRDRLNDEAFNRSLRPYPQYKGFDLYWSWPLGRYQRDAGYFRMEKRMTKGLTMSAYYEFSKQMDDYSGPGIQDFFHRENEWSLTAGNNPQRFSVTYSYELPLGASKALLSWSDWRRHFVGGWSISGTSTLSSGEPLALTPQFNNTGAVISALRVNVVPGVDPAVPDRGPESWFNPAAFDQPPDFTPGNASRTHPSLLTPSNQNHDLSVTKRVAIAADRTLEITAVGFNFLNHANWNDPDTMIGPASAPNVNAGKIIGSRGGRVVQLGMRLSF